KCVSREQNSFLQMSANFDLNHHRLAGDSKFATIASNLSTQSRIDSRAAFNRYCRKACLLWSEHFSNGPVGTTARFPEFLDRIGAPSVCRLSIFLLVPVPRPLEANDAISTAIPTHSF